MYFWKDGQYEVYKDGVFLNINEILYLNHYVKKSSVVCC